MLWLSWLMIFHTPHKTFSIIILNINHTTFRVIAWWRCWNIWWCSRWFDCIACSHYMKESINLPWVNSWVNCVLNGVFESFKNFTNIVFRYSCSFSVVKLILILKPCFFFFIIKILFWTLLIKIINIFYALNNKRTNWLVCTALCRKSKPARNKIHQTSRTEPTNTMQNPT